METVFLSEQYKNNTACVLAAGNFDGIHKGHKQVIESLLKTADENGLTPAIINFEPNPTEYFRDIKGNYRLTHIEEKQLLFSKLGIKKLFIANFNADFANLSAEDFLKKIITEKLNAKILITGEDFIFGKNRTGNSEFIKNNKNDFEYKKVNLLTFGDNKKYSSTDIRNLINHGKIEHANELLGHEFFIIQKVIDGDKNGKKLGFPTANIDICSYIKPKKGVYQTKTIIDGKEYDSIANFGNRPTIKNDEKEILENHILNFSENIYGKSILIKFTRFIREEKKFNSLQELKDQIQQDINSLKL